jgi:hypothetical protein
MRRFAAYLEYAISLNGDEPRKWLHQLLLHFMRQSLLPLFCTLGVGNKLGQTSIGLTGGLPLSIQSKNCDNKVRALGREIYDVSKGACIHPQTLTLALRLRGKTAQCILRIYYAAPAVSVRESNELRGSMSEACMAFFLRAV